MTDTNAPADGGQGGAAPAAAPAWYAGLPEEQRGYVQLKGWKGPEDVLSSYINLEKLRGVPAERLLALPEKPDDPKWAEVHQRLGVPAKPEEYGFKVPDGMEPEFATKAAEWMHARKIPKDAASGLLQDLTGYLAEFEQQQEAALETEAAAQVEELKSEWGQHHDKNLETARRAARQFGLDEATLSAVEGSLGYKATMTLFQRIGAALLEPEPVGMGNGAPGGIRVLTPEAAKARIAQLQSDRDFGAKYIAGDAEARAEMERLHRLAYPGA